MRSLEIKFSEIGVVEVEGIRFHIDTLKDALRNPPNNLFSVKREGDQLIFTTYCGLEAATKFFEDNKSA